MKKFFRVALVIGCILAQISAFSQAPGKPGCEDINCEDINLEMCANSLDSKIREKFVGQTQAIKAVQNSLLKAAPAFKKRQGFLELLFVGPSGVGKTRLAELIAEKLGKPLVFLSERFATEILPIGSYILVVPVDENPWYANPIIEYVKENRKNQFSNMIIIVTAHSDRSNPALESVINRIESTNVINFQSFSQPEIRQLAEQFVTKMVEKLSSGSQFFVNVDPSVIDYIVSAYNPKHGARWIRNFVEDLEEPIYDEVLKVLKTNGKIKKVLLTMHPERAEADQERVVVVPKK